MGFLSAIKKKISSLSASIKDSRRYRPAYLKEAVKSADLKKDTFSGYNAVNGFQLRTGESNFIEKTAYYEDFSTAHFDKNFAKKHKNIDDVLAFVKNLANFIPESEYRTQINTANRRRRSSSSSPTQLSVEGLFEYFSGGQNLSEEDIIAYSNIAKNTQAKARALAYIKANFVSICNMRSLSDKDEKASLDKYKELFSIIKDYCDEDINKFNITEFNPENINSEILSSEDNLLKGAYFAQIRCDELVKTRINQELDKADKLNQFAEELYSNMQTYDKSIDAIDNINNAKLAREQALALKLEETDEKLIEALDYFRRMPSCSDKTLEKLWITGKRDAKKAGTLRQQELLDSLERMVRSSAFDMYDAISQKQIDALDKQPYSQEERLVTVFDSNSNETDKIANLSAKDFSIFDGEAGDYNAFINTLVSYNEYDGVDHSGDILRVRVDDSQEPPMLYTDRQEKVLKSIYLKLNNYAKQMVNSADFDGNPLKNLCYSSLRKSIDDNALDKLATILYGDNVRQGQIFTYPTFAKLSVKQLEAIGDFVTTYKPVKSFLQDTGLKESDLDNYEIDRQLVEQLSPEKSPRYCKLKYVMNSMQRSALEYNRETLKQRQEQNEKAINSNLVDSETLFEDAKICLENIQDIYDENKTIAEKEEYEIAPDTVAQGADSNNDAKDRIDTFAYGMLQSAFLPDEPEQINQNTVRLGKIQPHNSLAFEEKTFEENIDELVQLTKDTLKDYSNDLKKLPKLTKKQKAELYAKHITASDYKTISNWTNFISETVKALQTSENFQENENSI